MGATAGTRRRIQTSKNENSQLLLQNFCGAGRQSSRAAGLTLGSTLVSGSGQDTVALEGPAIRHFSVSVCQPGLVHLPFRKTKISVTRPEVTSLLPPSSVSYKYWL